MFLDGRRISEWATDTKVIPENESSEELSLLEHKNQSSLITYKRGFFGHKYFHILSLLLPNHISSN